MEKQEEIRGNICQEKEGKISWMNIEIKPIEK